MFGIRFVKVPATTYVIHYKKGRIQREGAGLSFFYYAPTSDLVEVPLSSTDVPFVFNEVTADFQDATIQGELTYRVSDPKRIAALLDYGVDSHGRYRSDDPAKLNDRLVHAAQILARSFTQRNKLRDLLVQSDALVAETLAGLQQSPAVAMLGVEILGLSILSIKGTPEMSKALQAGAREELLRQADEAIYARRNAAVELERTIKENELNTEIAVELKNRQVRETQMSAEISVEEQRAVLVDHRVVNDRKEADARGHMLAATLAPLKDVDWRTLMAASGHNDAESIIALAFRDLAENAGKIGELNVSPELLTALLRRPKDELAPCCVVFPVKSAPGIVIVTRPTRLEGLRQRWGTASQAKFLLRQAHAIEAEQARGRGKRAAATAVATPDAEFGEYQRESDVYQQAIESLQRELDFGLPVKTLDRSFVPNFDFWSCAVVVVVGQDGLVANTAKYVGGLPIVAVNPDPAHIDGILLPFQVHNVRDVVGRVLENRYKQRPVTLAEVRLNDGQRMLAFNDFFVGARTHVSARYTIGVGGKSEPQSSSGVLISTGAGSTGWLSSVFNMASGIGGLFGAASRDRLQLAWEDRRLVWAVREPFVSKSSQANLVAGMLDEGDQIVLESLMPEGGVIFSDGIELDFLPFTSGTIARVQAAEQRANLVVG